MAFPAEMLNSTEQIVLDLRPHWWFFAKPMAALLGAIVFGLVSLVVVDGGGTARGILDLAAGLLILAAVVWFGITYLRWTTTNFVVTTDRLINRTGILAREGIEIPLEKINTVFFRQTIFERIIRSGDLEIESAGEMGNQDFSDIRRPLNVQNEIYRQMEDNENRKFDRVGRNLAAQQSAPTPAPAPTISIPEQIEKLNDLRIAGALTDAEFDAKKAELLRRL